MNDKYTTINKAGEFRIFLHRLLSENSGYIETLKSYINNEFETLSTEYTEWQKAFQFKIKKSNLKKKNFRHTVDFYYGYLDNALYNFLTDPSVQLAINDNFGYNSNIQNIKEAYDEIRSRELSCRYLYSITTAQDNIVILTI